MLHRIQFRLANRNDFKALTGFCTSHFGGVRDLYESSGGSTISSTSFSNGSDKVPAPAAPSTPISVGLASPMTPSRFSTAGNPPMYSSQPPWLPSTPQRTVSNMLAEVEERVKETQLNSQLQQDNTPPTTVSSCQPSLPLSPLPPPPGQQMPPPMSPSSQRRSRPAPEPLSWDGTLTEQMMLSLINDDSFRDEVLLSSLSYSWVWDKLTPDR